MFVQSMIKLIVKCGGNMRNTIKITHVDLVMKLAGNLDEHFEYIEKLLDVVITIIGDEIVIEGSTSEKASKVLNNLIEIIQLGDDIDTQKIEYALELIESGEAEHLSDLYASVICVTKSGKSVHPMTLGQKSM